ncbi:MAG: response regulator [Gammaproteobacteria bacterium]|jgi:twitching motility two-component system response regulator PilH
MALVLIVDDSPTEVHVLGGYLKKHGFDIEAASDGREGIDKARSLKPDVVLMDVVMPGMNGFQATRELARAPDTADIPVVMVTTKGLETDRIWGMRQGARDYLVKPVSETQLVEKVRAALEQPEAGDAGGDD